MAYLTLHTFPEDLSPENRAQFDSYITTAMGNGTTDGISIPSYRVGVPGELFQRSWSTSSSASDFITFINGFTPPPNYAVVVNPLLP